MASLSLLGFWLFSLTQATPELHSTDHLRMFALQGDSVTLPCGIPSIKSCSSINWLMEERFGFVSEVVKAGRVIAPSGHRHRLLKDCSLEITHLDLNDTWFYSCQSGSLNSNVSLQLLEISESKSSKDLIELHCFLNTFKGSICSKNDGTHIKWSAEDDTPINGSRFRVENECFSKLFITKKPTDHHRKWKCHLTQKDEVKATTSYTTTVEGGIEEVFAAVGESVSLTCSTTSLLGPRGTPVWAMWGKPLKEQSQTKAFNVNKDSKLLIGEVSSVHAGDYECSESAGERSIVLNTVRLHTLDVIAEPGPGEQNLTLTCLLTCAKQCESDFTLTWSGSDQKGRQSELMSVNNTLIKELRVPVRSTRSDELTCSVHREGARVASKKWGSVHSLQTSAWVGLLISLLVCAVAGGLCTYIHKRKHNRDAETDEASIGMTHVYDVIQEVNNEELQEQGPVNRETTALYDLLQAVN
ncbi:uncharacterized protein LOC125016448 [Mugil cephalus]|uniref:uncharacterized protein LOC125016448 n=1 Tax=Mugil cephalus TaxID=48193 RepID=UPI001FB82C62|nr:uncharacterized protein LOC125016448 [Mugil cephalus]